MLFKLKPLDVDVRQDHTPDEHDPDDPDCQLDLESSAESVPRGHERPDGTDHGQQEDDIPIDPMHEYKLVPDRRNELEHDEEARRENAG